MLVYVERNAEKVDVSEDVFEGFFVYCVVVVGLLDLCYYIGRDFFLEFESHGFSIVSEVGLDEFF